MVSKIVETIGYSGKQLPPLLKSTLLHHSKKLIYKHPEFT